MKMKIFLLLAVMVLPSIASAESSFTLFSSDLEGQISEAQVLNGFGCEGKNISPALRWKNPPKGTKSFAVTVYDPDAPTGSGWWHWIVFDISKDIGRLKTNSGNSTKIIAPKGSVQSTTPASALPGMEAHVHHKVTVHIDISSQSMLSKLNI